MDHSNLLEQLGGPHAVHAQLLARGVKIKPVAVRAWALPGRTIPAKYWTAIAEIADEQGRAISFEELAASVSAAPDRADAA